MIQSLTASRIVPDASSAPGVAGIADGRFALSLAAIGGPGDAPAMPVERQVATVDGNALPDGIATQTSASAYASDAPTLVAVLLGSATATTASTLKTVVTAGGNSVSPSDAAPAAAPIATPPRGAIPTAMPPALLAGSPPIPIGPPVVGRATTTGDPKRAAKGEMGDKARKADAAGFDPRFAGLPIIPAAPIAAMLASDAPIVAGRDPARTTAVAVTAVASPRAAPLAGQTGGDAPAPAAPQAIAAGTDPAMIIDSGPAVAPALPGTGGTGIGLPSATVSPALGVAMPRAVPMDTAQPAERRFDTAKSPGPLAPLPLAGATIVATSAAIAPRMGSAARVFATALHQAAQPDAAEAKAPDAIVAATQTAVAQAPVVTAAANAGQTTLDMGHRAWPEAMIAHIERLRDAADAADTSIRVVPDALGTIDIAVRRDGDAVHVHMTAEQATTRAMLADAQPKLVELADQRGLKLGQTSIGAGAGGGSGGGQPQSQPRDATRPASAFATVVAPDAAADEPSIRLA